MVKPLSLTQEDCSKDLATNSSKSVSTIPPIDVVLMVRRRFDMDELLQVRDSLLKFLEQLPSPEPNSVPPQVKVASEQDRLAMLQPRDRHDRPEANKSETQTIDFGKIQADEIVTGLLDLLELPRAEIKKFIDVNKANQFLAMRENADVSDVEQELLPVENTNPLLRHHPVALLEQLQSLATKPASDEWAESVHDRLLQLLEVDTTAEADGVRVLAELEELALAGDEQAEAIADLPVQHEWRQTKQALKRRLPLWRSLLSSTAQESTAPLPAIDQSNMMPVLQDLVSLFATEPNGNDWREYLLLDRIAAAASEGAGIDVEGRRKLAHEVLARMSDSGLSSAQEEFLASAPLASLREELEPWAAKPVDLDRLAALVERYESGREVRFAEAIAQVQQQLLWSGDTRLQSLGKHLEQHYRHANMRIAVTDDLLNRMMPTQEPIVAPVREKIAGSRVRGSVQTTTELNVRLLPDPRSWQFDLQATGKVYSNTESETWPAWVRNRANMQYEAKKTITIDRKGLHASPAQAQAQGRHDLVGVDSQFDGVPLLGYLLRDFARQKNYKSRPRAMSQVKSKVARRAEQRMDSEADPKLESLEQKFRNRVLSPIEQLALIADPVAMYTTEDRAVMRLRLANDGQLAAHTLRPLAPSDSVASVQLHETVLNNALAGLHLDGRRMKLDELFQFFAEKLGKPDAVPPADLPTRAVLEFASRDAVLICSDGDRIELVLNIRELSHGWDKIRNFQVHAFFRPVFDGLDVRLVRDGTLQFAGHRLLTGPRIVLHSVIGKLLPKDQEILVLGGKLQDDPRLEGLMVTQLVLDDGWIALALGPAHAERNVWQSIADGDASESLVR